MYGNARWDDNIIYMSKVITVGLYIKVIVQPCNQEKVASSNCENYKWLVWKFHHKTFNFGRLFHAIESEKTTCTFRGSKEIH
jgi:hypothetical protein